MLSRANKIQFIVTDKRSDRTVTKIVFYMHIQKNTAVLEPTRFNYHKITNKDKKPNCLYDSRPYCLTANYL